MRIGCHATPSPPAKRRGMKQVLSGMIEAHEIQGCIALENIAPNRVGLDRNAQRW